MLCINKEAIYALPRKGSLELAHPPIAQLGDDLKEFSTPKSTMQASPDWKERQLFEEKVDLENVTKRKFSLKGNLLLLFLFCWMGCMCLGLFLTEL